MRKKSSVSLKTLSTIQIGGTAKKVLWPENLNEFIEILKAYPEAPVIGGGSNIFFSETELPAVLVTKKLSGLRENKDGSITAECGYPLADLFGFAAGVPATVGGAVVMNFGAFGREIKDYLLAVKIFDLIHDSITVPVTDLVFEYRNSSLRRTKKIVLEAIFKNKDLSGKKEYLEKRRRSIPYEYPNIGSIFKNPPGASAGALIEQAGLKGYRIGGAMVSEKHANILVNAGQASTTDLLQLIAYVKDQVEDKFQIDLEAEIEGIGV